MYGGEVVRCALFATQTVLVVFGTAISSLAPATDASAGGGFVGDARRPAEVDRVSRQKIKR